MEERYITIELKSSNGQKIRKEIQALEKKGFKLTRSGMSQSPHDYCATFTATLEKLEQFK